MQWWKRIELWLAVVAAVLLLQGYLEIRLGGDRPAGSSGWRDWRCWASPTGATV
jgi:hypothetical protein